MSAKPLNIHLDRDLLRQSLSDEQFRVTCESATEPPFRNAYWNNKRSGLYVDVVSGAPLFVSTDKFESGTGWPSFTRPLDSGALEEVEDLSHGMRRVEVRAASSGAHLGHVFEDGPHPTGRRYCINSASLRFIPAEELAKEGYSKHASLFENKSTTSTAVFAAGCFWGVEEYFRRVAGVTEVISGYTGGETEHPDYQEVCSGLTGHAEAVQISFDPAIVSYETLLEHFWRLHDPTSLNRQGNDRGTQYRSAIFWLDEEQRDMALRSRDRLQQSKRVTRPVVTEIIKAGTFWPAEEYHQQYLRRNPGGYCHIDLSLAKEPVTN